MALKVQPGDSLKALKTAATTNTPKRIATPAGSVAGYLPPSEGPFSCDNCEYYVNPNNCSRPEVLKELGDPDGDGYADVEPKGCCNFYQKE